MSHQSRGRSRCQKGARSRAHDFGIWHPQLGENRPLRQQRCIFRLSEALSPSNRGLRRMHMQFSRITSFVDLQIWNATSDGFSFVISFESRSGPGLRGRPGFVASWRPIYQNRSA